MAVELFGEDGYFKFEYSKVVTVKEVMAAYDALVASENFDRVKFGMFDCRKIESVDYGTTQYNQHGAYATAASRARGSLKLRLGIVITEDWVEEAAKRAISAAQQFGMNWERKIFRDWDEAISWASGKS